MQAARQPFGDSRAPFARSFHRSFGCDIHIDRIDLTCDISFLSHALISPRVAVIHWDYGLSKFATEFD
jgi:hypothetical protein